MIKAATVTMWMSYMSCSSFSLRLRGTVISVHTRKAQERVEK